MRLHNGFRLATKFALLGIFLSGFSASSALAMDLSFGLVNTTLPTPVDSRLTMIANATLIGSETKTLGQFLPVTTGVQAGEGSLTTTYQDLPATDSKILADVTRHTIEFTGGSTAIANTTSRNNGVAYAVKPGIGGAGANGAADYGLLINTAQDTELPPLDIGELLAGATLNLGTLTSIDVNVALRDVVLDVTSDSPLALTPGATSPQSFDPKLLDIILTGKSDILLSATFDQEEIGDTLAIVAALTLLGPTLEGYGIVLTNSYNLLGSTVTIGFASTTEIPATLLSNSTAIGSGVLEHFGSNLRLTTPININLPLSSLPDPLGSLVSGTLGLSGQLIGETPYVFVPEPSSFVLAGLGVAGLIAVGRRRKK